MEGQEEEIYLTHHAAYQSLLGSKRLFIDLLHYKYLLTDVHGYHETQLEGLSNLIGVIFLLERKTEVHAFMEELGRLTQVLEKLPISLFRLFRTWIRIATNQGLSDAQKQQVNEIINRFTEPKEVSILVVRLKKAFEGIGY
ncbi:hypothetical protein ACFOQM_20345 [Paenibacillus sp. GCM10012307]|uniref:Uncharacterized protein n=1 Tax=Paenibacillus roseus TaxID=2798579 RepID=A0A934MS56_9BACL|nr:hypothetical protein [Paenibacillus roseus]MBJ6363578.1 hypothetical protein [Paenibacillus roseus]